MQRPKMENIALSEGKHEAHWLRTVGWEGMKGSETSYVEERDGASRLPTRSTWIHVGSRGPWGPHGSARVNHRRPIQLTVDCGIFVRTLFFTFSFSSLFIIFLFPLFCVPPPLALPLHFLSSLLFYIIFSSTSLEFSSSFQNISNLVSYRCSSCFSKREHHTSIILS